jgi:F0F1-type ATP synthase delta subunit
MTTCLTRNYAEALYCALQGKAEGVQEIIIDRFIRTLTKSGHTHLGKNILRVFEALDRERSNEYIILRVTHDTDVTRFESHIERDKKLLRLPANSVCIVEYDDTLVGGYELRTRDVRIDRTYKRVLRDLYISLISSE